MPNKVLATFAKNKLQSLVNLFEHATENFVEPSIKLVNNRIFFKFFKGSNQSPLYMIFQCIYIMRSSIVQKKLGLYRNPLPISTGVRSRVTRDYFFYFLIYPWVTSKIVTQMHSFYFDYNSKSFFFIGISVKFRVRLILEKNILKKSIFF